MTMGTGPRLLGRLRFIVREPRLAMTGIVRRLKRPLIRPYMAVRDRALSLYYALEKRARSQFYSLKARAINASDNIHGRWIAERLRRSQICLLALRRGDHVAMIPIDRADGPFLAQFAPTIDEYEKWLADPRVSLDIIKGGDAIFRRVGVQPPSASDWRVLSYVLHTNPRKFISRSRGVIPTREFKLEAILATGMFDPAVAPLDVGRRRAILALASRDPDLAPLLHTIETADTHAQQCPPYGEDPVAIEEIGVKVPAEPRKRSVLFVNPSYYNFTHLADSLRKRGWDAVSMAIVDPSSEYAKQFHGFDWKLFEADANALPGALREKFKEVAGRFDMLHFTGVGTMSFFPYNYDTSIDHERIPWDILEMKRRGAKIAYSITGCHDLITQTNFEAWSPTTCPKCAWRDQPTICSDRRMAAWGWKVQQLADLICVETDPPLDFRDTPAVFREPLSFAVDPDFWHPDLARGVAVPEEWREPKEPGEILIYHSVGNYELRTRNGVNVKGTGAVIRAIERLKAEGHPVRLLFRKEVPSLHNRWMLAQADIIVDQLNYGRYGATAREGLMLGRPVVGRLNKIEPRGLAPTRCIAESPVVDASEETVYEVLKRLVESPEERARIGAESRTHALQWWSKDVLAERYERVYDHLRAHGRPPATLDAKT